MLPQSGANENKMNKFSKIIIDSIFLVIFGWVFIQFVLMALYTLAIFMPESARGLSNLIGLVIFGFIAYAIFRSKTGTVIKAASLVALLEAVSATIGRYIGGQMIIIYSLNALAAILVVYFLYRLKASWHYYLAVALFGLFLVYLLAMVY